MNSPEVSCFLQIDGEEVCFRQEETEAGMSQLQQHPAFGEGGIFGHNKASSSPNMGFGAHTLPSPTSSMSPHSASASSPSDSAPASAPARPATPPTAPGTLTQRERDRMREAERRRRAAMMGRIDLNQQQDMIATFESQMY